MNKIELRRALVSLGVPSSIYSLSGGQADERVCLYQYDEKWRVSFFERGQERVLGTFATEVAACEFMLEELRREI